MRRQPQGCGRGVDRGTGRLGMELRNHANFSGADVVLIYGRPHCRRRKLKSAVDRAGSRRAGPQACLETPSARSGRPQGRPPLARGGPVREGEEPHVWHARCWGVGGSHSTEEAPERRRVGNRWRRGWREGDRPRRTSRALPWPDTEPGYSRRRGCWVCAQRRASTLVSKAGAV
jgi:hypothetical protein